MFLFAVFYILRSHKKLTFAHFRKEQEAEKTKSKE
jgi:hypothetical protein